MNYKQTMIKLVGEINEKLPSFVEYVIFKNKGHYAIEPYIKTTSKYSKQHLENMGIGCIVSSNTESHKWASNNLVNRGFIGSARVKLWSDETNYKPVPYFFDTPKNMLKQLTKFHNRVINNYEFTLIEEWICAKGFTEYSTICGGI